MTAGPCRLVSRRRRPAPGAPMLGEGAGAARQASEPKL